MDTTQELTSQQIDAMIRAEKNMSDAEIKSLLTKEWSDLFDALWYAIGKPIDQKQKAVYARALSNIPYGLLDKAINKVLQEHKYSNIPTIAEIINAVRSVLGISSDANLENNIAIWKNNVWFKTGY